MKGFCKSTVSADPVGMAFKVRHVPTKTKHFTHLEVQAETAFVNSTSPDSAVIYFPAIRN